MTLNWASGSYEPGGDYAGYQSFVGHTQKMATCFGSRDTVGNLENPSYLWGSASAAGLTVVESFQGILSGGGEDWRTISRTTLQTRAKAFGDNLVAAGQVNAVIRMRTEADNGSSGDSGANAWDSNDISAYASCIQAIYTGLHQAAGNNFICLADVAYDPGDPTPKINLLNAVLQWCDGFGLDSYNSAVPWGSNWTTPADQWTKRLNGFNGGFGYKAYLDFALAHNKPIGIPEFGEGWFYSNNGAQQEPLDAGATYMTNMYNLLMTHGVKVLFVCYWEDNNGLYLSRASNPQPNTTAAWRAGFGSADSAPWPLTSAPPAPAPNAPTIGTATAGVGQVSVSFSPASAGATATSFAVTLSNGLTATGASSPIVVTSPAGVAVTATVKAVNAAGSSAASAASNSVLPTAPPASSITLHLLAADGATSTITVSIPTIAPHVPNAAHVQDALLSQQASVSDYQLAFPSPNGLGNTLLAVTGWDTTNAATPTLTDTLGNVWQQVGTLSDTTNGAKAVLWKCVGCKAGANTVKLHLSAANAWPLLGIYEASGVGDIRVSAGAYNAATNSPRSGLTATSVPVGDLLVEFCMNTGNATVPSAGTDEGYTPRSSTPVVGSRWGDLVQATAGQANGFFGLAGTAEPSVAWVVALAAK